MWYPNIWIRESPGKGDGVFALSDIPEWTLICEYIGNIMTKKEIKKANLDCQTKKKLKTKNGKDKKEKEPKDDLFDLFENKDG